VKLKNIVMSKGLLKAVKDYTIIDNESKCWGNNLSGGLEMNENLSYEKIGVGKG
jgi:hypothetical protein